MTENIHPNVNGNNSNSILNDGGEMKKRIRDLNWSLTPVGAIETWPQSLKATMKTLLGSRYPMILLWGNDLIQIYNDAYTGLIGGKHPDALGRSIRETQAESWETIGPMIHEVMDTGVPNWVPAQMLAVNRFGFSEETYFSLSYSPVENDKGIIEGMLCVCSEVTQQVLGERRLRLQRDLASKAGETRNLQTVCKDVGNAMAEYKWDAPFSLLYLSAPNGILNLCSSVGLGNNSQAKFNYFDTKDDGYDPWSLKKALVGETILTKNVDEIALIPGGPWNESVKVAITLPIPSSAKKAPLGVMVCGLSPNHSLDEAYISFFELLAGQVSVAMRNAIAYEEEHNRAEALAEIGRAKTTFFNNVSHEFRTPLTLMLGPLEDIISKSSTALTHSDHEQLKTVYQNALRLLKLVNTLLDFSRFEAKRMEASFQKTDLCSFTSQLASVFESAIKKAGLKYEVSCPPLSKHVLVDKEIWEKIVLNLLSNALKYTLYGTISLGLEERESHMRLTVKDTGVGIPEKEMPNLFKRFHRIQNTNSRSHEGTGIGLALVKELVELHKGTIEVSSILGKGTTFTVQIPKNILKNHQTTDDEIIQNPSISGTRAFVNEANLWGKSFSETKIEEERQVEPEGLALVDKNIRILLVDDNVDMLHYLTRILGLYWTVEVAGDGVEALAKIKERAPDLILSDVMMPRMNGLELLSEVRKDTSITHIPLILLSARAGEESTIEGLQQGADDYLVKPFSARELLARTKTQLEIRKTRRDNTLLRDAEEQLKKFKIITDFAFDSFILMREDGSFAYLNDQALNRWGYTREEAQYIKVPDVDPIYQEEKFKEVFAQAQKVGAIPPFETIHRKKNGITFPVEVSLGSLVLDGKPHMFAVARDISERKHSEETLKLRNEQLLKINNELDNFIYTASHDLKAPITNIEGLTSLLILNLPPETLEFPVIKKVLPMMKTSIDRFKNTINDLSEMSKLQKNLEDDISEVRFDQILEEVMLDLDIQIATSKARFACDFNNCPTVQFSRKNLRSILFNLVSNSIKYKASDRDPVIRIVSGKDTEHAAVLTVEDNGLGMDLNKESKIFSMFKRLHDHVEGSGVGLYIVKKIVENSGGKITVDSSVGKGSIFKVYFKSDDVFGSK